MTEKRFVLDDAGELIDLNNHKFIDYGEECCNLLNELHEENEELKQQLQNTSDQRDEFHRGARENANRVGKLKKKNEQLKQRNDRQAKQLDRLYNLIEQKDWRTLTDILDDFCSCEERLQREWRTYK